MIHPRSDWGALPPKSTTPLVAAQVQGVAVHWLGPAADASNVPALLRGIQAFHTGPQRGWNDIAYNLAVDPTGDIWVLRGLENRSAANGNVDVNERFVAVVALLGQGQTPTGAMLDGIRDAVALIRNRYPSAAQVHGHQDVFADGTACPGPDLEASVRSHRFEPQPVRQGVAPMYSPALVLAPIVADLAAPHGGAWLLADDGSVYAFGGAPYCGGANGQAYFAGRHAARLEVRPDGGYDILDTANERYQYPKVS